MSAKQMTVGSFVDRLRELPKDMNVSFMFGGCPDLEVCSYRGDYSEAALGWSGGSYGTRGVPAKALADSIEAQIGTQMTGWKGGEYIITAHTLLWCDNAGNWSRCAVTGVRDHGIILVEWRE